MPNEEAAAMIMSMGFERNHVISALKATENNLDRALDWIMSHGPEVQSSVDTMESEDSAPKFRDGKGGKFLTPYYVLFLNINGILISNILQKSDYIIFLFQCIN